MSALCQCAVVERRPSPPSPTRFPPLPEPLPSTQTPRTVAASSLPNRLDRAAQGPSWGQLLRQHAAQYIGLAVLLLVLALSERWQPFRRTFYTGHTADLELWRYSYPLRANHVPAWAVPCVAVSVPITLVVAWLLAGRISRAEAHATCLVVLYCVATTGTLTNWIKNEVGRPRPHFNERCWPGGLKPTFTPEGYPLCADTAVDPAEGIKSFPRCGSAQHTWQRAWLGVCEGKEGTGCPAAAGLNKLS